MTIPSFEGPTRIASEPVGGLLSGTSNFQPQVIALDGGGFAVLWIGFATAPADADQGRTVFARLYDADRAPLGDAFVVASDLAGEQGDFLAAATADGGFAAAFLDGSVGQSATATTLARFDASGAKVGQDLTIETTDDFSPGNVGLAGFGDGTLALLQVNNTSRDFQLIRVAADNTLLAPAASLDPGTASVGAANVLTTLDNGSVAFVEIARVQDGFAFRNDAVLHEISADGSLRSVTLAEGLEGQLEFAVLPSGVALVTELAFAPDFLSVTGEMRRFALDGAQIGDAIPIARPYDSSAVFVEDPQGGFYRLFTTNNVSSAPFQDSFAQRYDADGAPEGAPFLVHRDDAGFQARPAGAFLEGGDLVVAIESSESGFATTRILLQGLDPSGTTAGSAPTRITLDADPIAPGGPGGVIGTLGALDPDAGDSFTFELVFGAPFFELAGDVLSHGGRFTVADDATYNQVTIRVTDSKFNTFTQVVEIPFETEGGGGGGGEAVAPVIWRGTRRGDKKNGDAGDDVLNGRGGNDRLDGKGGADKLIGGAGNDRLKGGAGADEIVGGRGRDVLVGGGGPDDFVFGRRDGRDRITDFQTGVDDLEFTSGAKRFKHLTISQKGDDLHVKNGKTLIVLEDVDRSDFDAGDVAFV